MKTYRRVIGFTALTLLTALTISGPASAETSQLWCEFSGGTWNGAILSDGSASTWKGICTFALVGSPDQARQACANVGGKTGAPGTCAVSSENISKAKASTEFRAATGEATSVPLHQEGKAVTKEGAVTGSSAIKR